MPWRTNFSNFLKLTKNLAHLTAGSYYYAARRYANFASNGDPADIDSLPFSQTLIRNYAAGRRGEVGECTIEHEVHGILAFWKFCYENKNPIKPLSFKELDLPIKCSKNPTHPLTHVEYSLFMEKIYEQLVYIY